MTEEKRADARMEQIISSIITEDKEKLKSLFSEKSLSENDNIDDEIQYLFDFVHGDVDSWERDGWSSDETIEMGKKSLMIRSGYKVVTSEERYFFFVVDYNLDTINPDNEGVYMLQAGTLEYDEDLGSWQERLRAGIYIPELGS